MDTFFSEFLAARYNYWIYIALMMIGLWAMIGKNNLVKKVIGMNIFQTAIILFYVSTAMKKGATLPIIEHHAAGPETEHAAEAGLDLGPALAHATEHAPEAAHGAAHGAAEAVAGGAHDAAHAAAGMAHAAGDAAHAAVKAIDYINPLPHVLMLTAIVVSVATLGVALALLLKVHADHGTLEEDQILARLKR